VNRESLRNRELVALLDTVRTAELEMQAPLSGETLTAW